MKPRVMILLSLFVIPSAYAGTITCTASCILGTEIISVHSKGIDSQDAVIELYKKCDDAAEKAKAKTHYLATSFNKPTANFTMIQTEFDVQKACF